MPPSLRALPLALLLLTACGGDAPAPAAPVATAAAPKAAGVDWSRCRFPGLELPVPGRLFVVDGGDADPGAEPGRESIRRVDILVPGPVALLLTAEDASVWLLRPSPQTQIRAVLASGPQPQRITGQVLGPARLSRSQSLGDDCGRYWLADGPGEALAEATEQVFGRKHDAVYGLQAGRVVIGDASSVPQLPSATALPGAIAPAPSASNRPGAVLPPPTELSAGATPVAAPRGVVPGGGNAERIAIDALRTGALRYAHKGDFRRWADRRVEMGAAALAPDVEKRLLAMPAYIVVSEFTIGPAFSGDQASVFYVEPRGVEPQNKSTESMVLGMALGTCQGAGCPPAPPTR